jgi:AmmeMemoRadiSam system protein B
MPATLDCPRLRPGLELARDAYDPQFFFIFDPRKVRPGNGIQRLNRLELMWVQMFDGRHSLREIQVEAMRLTGGEFLPLEWFTALVERLDEALFLDSPRLRSRLGSVREPSCIGCYEEDPAALRRQLTGLFTHAKGPGLPRTKTPDGQIRAALLPHIDFARGGPAFAWGFKEVFERTDASLFVIIGTSHLSMHRFTLTRQDFQTPLGVARADQTYIDRLVGHYGDGLFDDELAHLPEWSIELEVVFLQYLYEGKRPFRIVPLVVGSFHDCIEANHHSPASAADIGRMVEALRRTEAETPEPICYIISGDLAHIGPKFGDPLPVDESFLTQSRQQDHTIIRQAELAKPEGYFRVIAEEGDRRRICGLPPTFTVLEACRPSKGKLLLYDQYVHPQGFESVSFASMAFYR